MYFLQAQIHDGRILGAIYNGVFEVALAARFRLSTLLLSALAPMAVILGVRIARLRESGATVEICLRGIGFWANDLKPTPIKVKTNNHWVVLCVILRFFRNKFIPTLFAKVSHNIFEKAESLLKVLDADFDEEINLVKEAVKKIENSLKKWHN